MEDKIKKLEEKIKVFCSFDPIRPTLLRPFYSNQHYCATNSYVLICSQEKFKEEDTPKAPNINSFLKITSVPSNLKNLAIKKIESIASETCSTCGGIGLSTKCDECGGTGWVDLTFDGPHNFYEEEKECIHCHGDGFVGCDRGKTCRSCEGTGQETKDSYQESAAGWLCNNNLKKIQDCFAEVKYFTIPDQSYVYFCNNEIFGFLMTKPEERSGWKGNVKYEGDTEEKKIVLELTDRPKWNEQMREKWNKKTVEMILEWDNECSYEEMLDVVEKLHLPYDSGYEFAKELEGSWDINVTPDSLLVEILENANDQQGRILHDAIKQWVDNCNILLNHEKGSVVQFSHRGKDYEGPITSLDHNQATYAIHVPELLSNSDSKTTGIVIKAECVKGGIVSNEVSNGQS